MDRELLKALQLIPASACTYEEWTEVGMALKHEGYDVDAWDQWSQGDARYKRGECRRKWATFKGSGDPVTGGTIISMAMRYGYELPKNEALTWDSEIDGSAGDFWAALYDPGWLEVEQLPEPSTETWSPSREAIRYLETLFRKDEFVGYVMESWQPDSAKGRYTPKNSGVYVRTCGELIADLKKYGDDLSCSFGSYNPAAGAWIRFNPLDGKGVKNDNVTDYRYALVECDQLDTDTQLALIKKMQLPVAALVHSGGKSIHAITRIDASTLDEYRRRVDYLYAECKKAGLELDTQNKNPSRLSRLPGVLRGDKKQYLIDTNVGFDSWDSWKEYHESLDDHLPELEPLSTVWDNLPPLAEPLIDGVLRKGHKMLIAGPSKAGKSFALIELCIAIAEGREWMAWQCAQGHVLYINLELDRASCLHRFADVYDALGWPAKNINNIDVWNLRGRAIPMDKLAPKLIRRAKERQYAAIVIDPIYKVITGDENAADQMATFCNQFDLIATELGASVIYCHHHSKSASRAIKAANRASGSGVFARDPDALLDLTELELGPGAVAAVENEVTLQRTREYLEDAGACACLDVIPAKSWAEKTTGGILSTCRKYLRPDQYADLMAAIEEAKAAAHEKTPWRVEGVLREFAEFRPVNLWFCYPVHLPDDTGVLAGVGDEPGRKSWYEKRAEGRDRYNENKKIARIAEFELAFTELAKNGGEVSMADLAMALGHKDTKKIGMWLGDSVHGKPELKEAFEKYQEPGKQTYVRRRPSYKN